jgi:putative ABC transport system permease protein
MFRQALSEVRRHPGRFISTLLAIAISVAFLAGSAVLVATEGQAQGKAINVAIASAEVVVTLPQDAHISGVGQAIEGTPGVAAFAPVLRDSTVVTTGAISQSMQLVNVPPEALRWASLTSGRWPTAVNEVTLSAGAASSLGAKLGGVLHIAGSEVGLTVVGLTSEPSGFFSKTGYAADAYFAAAGVTADRATTWSIKAVPGTDLAGLVDQLNQKLTKLDPDVKAQLAAPFRAKAVAKLASDFDVFANVLWGFAAVSLVVGMITIANTFTITLAQRRRQIGLLRAVGASGSQVRGRFLAEAAVLGVLGSLLGLALGLGIAVAVTAWSTALFWGLVLPGWQLALAFGLGVLATGIAAFVPIIRGTRVLPLEALQPAMSGDAKDRFQVWRILICGLLLVAGAAVAVLAIEDTSANALLIAIGAGALISAGVLFGGPLFVPSLLRASGFVVRRFGAVAKLAANNAERNPRRATATATALMLAIGLMVTLQVATASIRATVLEQLQQHYPVDVAITWKTSTAPFVSIPPESSAKLAAIDGVDASVLLASGRGELNGSQGVALLGYVPGVVAATGVQTPVGDDVVMVSPLAAKDLGKSVTVSGPAGKLTLKVVGSKLVDDSQAMVSAANLPKITKPTAEAVMWLSVPDRTKALSVIVAATEITGSQDRVNGAMAMAALYEQVLNILLAITTGLLAVAVLIALIGVSNTLGLSVLERTRESALLRALGLQASALRVMLLIEAMQVTLVGVVVGIVAGGFFGWLAATTTANSGGFDSVVYAVDVPQTLAMIVVAMAAAALASVLPGRRAAKAAPTEALADI